VEANTDRRCQIVGLRIGLSEAETFWSSFRESLARRGPRGVKLVISDAHEGLKAAIQRLSGASWHRCRVHWMRNALAYVPKSQQSPVVAAPVFLQAQPGQGQPNSARHRRLYPLGRPNWLDGQIVLDHHVE
jgi:putative transposase